MKKHFLTVVYAIDDKPETVEAILSQHPWQAVANTDALADLEHAQADMQAATDGYAAARLEIASLKVRAADARHDIDDLTARDESQRLRIAELEAQLAAIGAGGVEPLRKRECLHQIIEPAPSEWDVRGHLAESLTCWCRLTGQEAAELVALFQGRPEQASAPVVLPAPDAVLRFERSTAGKENEMPSVVSCNWLPDGEYKLYTEQQVRALLMHRKLND